MTRSKSLNLASIICAILLVATATPANAAKRIALIIGNSDYKYSGRLDNPSNDAHLLASTFRSAAFDVEVRTDLSQKAMKTAFKQYVERLRKAGPDAVGLFYFSGHGTQVNGQNYLLPVDANIESEGEVDAEAVSANSLMALLEEAKNNLNIIILDSCRNNPLKRGYRAQVRGLAPMKAPTSTLIAYATEPGNVAQDGTLGYSPYALSLQHAVRQPGLQIEQAFKMARKGVSDLTSGKQIPWEESSLFGDFSFTPKTRATGPNPASAPKSIASLPTEAKIWKDIRESRDPEAYRSYLKKHPAGHFALLANDKIIRLAELEAAKPAEKPATPGGSYFFDDFTGTDIAKHWDLLNPDEDSFIVEDGHLTLLLNNIDKPSADTIPNILRLLKPVPKGDWTLTVKIKIVPQTMSEYMTLGLSKRDGTGLTSALQVYTDNYGRNTRLYVRADKKGKKTSTFTRDLYKVTVSDARNIKGRSDLFEKSIKSIQLRLQKKGRQYYTSIKFEPVDENNTKLPAKDWVTLPKLTSLRLPGDKFTLALWTNRIDTYLPEGAESIVKIDWIRVDTP